MELPGVRRLTGTGAMLVRFSEKGDTASCPICNVVSNVSNASDPVYDSGKESGFIISATVMVVLAGLGGYFCFFGVKEHLGACCCRLRDC